MKYSIYYFQQLSEKKLKMQQSHSSFYFNELITHHRQSAFSNANNTIILFLR